MSIERAIERVEKHIVFSEKLLKEDQDNGMRVGAIVLNAKIRTYETCIDIFLQESEQSEKSVRETPFEKEVKRQEKQRTDKDIMNRELSGKLGETSVY